MIFTANTLKIIAIISMVVDHIGYYFYFMLPDETYYIFRIIGRIAMPIFAFFIVEGFFKTKDLKKYILRLLKLAVVTQVVIYLISLINIYFFENYITSIYTYGNIVFSFVISILIITFLDRIIEEIVKLKENIKNIKGVKGYNKQNIKSIIYYLICILMLFSLYFLIDFDYELMVPILIIALYISKKTFNFLNVKSLIKIEKVEVKNFISNIFCSISMLFVLLLTNLEFDKIIMFNILSTLFILLYNGRLGKKNKYLRHLFYNIFYIHHALLYLLAILVFYNFFKI